MCTLVKHVYKLVHNTAIFAGSNSFESHLFQSLLQQITLVLLGNLDILNPKYRFNPKLSHCLWMTAFMGSLGMAE